MLNSSLHLPSKTGGLIPRTILPFIFISEPQFVCSILVSIILIRLTTALAGSQSEQKSIIKPFFVSESYAIFSNFKSPWNAYSLIFIKQEITSLKIFGIILMLFYY